MTLAAAVLLGVANVGLVAACWRQRSVVAPLAGMVGVLAAVAAGASVPAGRKATDELAGSLAAAIIGAVLLVIGQVVQRLLDAEPDEGP